MEEKFYRVLIEKIPNTKEYTYDLIMRGIKNYTKEGITVSGTIIMTNTINNSNKDRLMVGSYHPGIGYGWHLTEENVIEIKGDNRQ